MCDSNAVCRKPHAWGTTLCIRLMYYEGHHHCHHKNCTQTFTGHFRRAPLSFESLFEKLPLFDALLFRWIQAYQLIHCPLLLPYLKKMTWTIRWILHHASMQHSLVSLLLFSVYINFDWMNLIAKNDKHLTTLDTDWCRYCKHSRWHFSLRMPLAISLLQSRAFLK